MACLLSNKQRAIYRVVPPFEAILDETPYVTGGADLHESADIVGKCVRIDRLR
jgi:hypothetical protein